MPLAQFFVPHIQVSAGFTPPSRMDYPKNRDLDWHSEVQILIHILDNHPFFTSACMEVTSHLKRFLWGMISCYGWRAQGNDDHQGKEISVPGNQERSGKRSASSNEGEQEGTVLSPACATFPSPTLLWQFHLGCGCKGYENLQADNSTCILHVQIYPALSKTSAWNDNHL